MNPFRLTRLRRIARVEQRYQLALIDSLDGRVDGRFLDFARDEVAAGESHLAFDTLFENLREENARLSHEQVERFVEVARALRLPFERYEHLAELEEFPEDVDPAAPVLPEAPPSIREAARHVRDED